MERMLKFLLVLSDFEAPLTSFETAFADRLKDIKRLSMGQLVGKVAKGIFIAREHAPSNHPDPRQVTVRYSFRLEDSEHLMKEWRKQQTRVVRERNQLVHNFINECDLRTIEGCEASASKLDQQRERMMSASQSLESMVNAVKKRSKTFRPAKSSLCLRHPAASADDEVLNVRISAQTPKMTSISGGRIGSSSRCAKAATSISA